MIYLFVSTSKLLCVKMPHANLNKKKKLNKLRPNFQEMAIVFNIPTSPAVIDMCLYKLFFNKKT